jgi:hypothetical protein
MDIKKTFATDSDKEKEGAWVEFGSECSVKIARINNPNYVREFRRLTKVHKQAIRRGTLDEETADDILIEAMAKSIVTDWKGLKEDGVEIPYSVENAIRLLKQYNDFREQVAEIASSIAAYQLEEDEDSEKNLSSS